MRDIVPIVLVTGVIAGNAALLNAPGWAVWGFGSLAFIIAVFGVSIFGMLEKDS